MDRIAENVDLAGETSCSAARVKSASLRAALRRPTRAEAEAAVKTLLAWAGEDTTREGLIDTPKRVAESWLEHFAGYREDPVAVLDGTFEEAHGYDDIVMLRDVRVESHCEHHIAPFIGVAHVAYMPNGRIVGISRLARVVEVLAKRLQTQERLTAQVAEAIATALLPRGVAVQIEAEHHCMATRGVRQPGVATITSRFSGVFETDAALRERFLRLTAPRRG